MFIKNEACICFLLTLFNYCFHHGVTPEAWFKTIIKPIPKSNLRSQSPADYRGISLQSFVAKTFSRLLNSRLREWLECNDTLSDEQNGFRTDRCCQYHIFALTSTIENRMVKGENDHHLKWPFSGCFTVEILNQKIIRQRRLFSTTVSKLTVDLWLQMVMDTGSFYITHFSTQVSIREE